MILNIGDVHLINEINDKLTKVFCRIKEGLDLFEFNDEITQVNLLGDIMDWEYISHRKIYYFIDFINMVKDRLDANNIHVLTGNHDKCSRNDGEQSSIMHFFFSGVVIKAPVIRDKILYIPHYYDKNNFDISDINPNDFYLIVAHAGTPEVFGEEEVTTTQLHEISGLKHKPIISGHFHNISLNPHTKEYFIGSIKSDSFRETMPNYSVCIIDDNYDPWFILIPYSNIHYELVVQDAEQIRKNIQKLFTFINDTNVNHILLDKFAKVSKTVPANKFITSNINLKFKLLNDSVNRKDLELIIESCRHNVENPTFMNIKIKPMYNLEYNQSTGKIKKSQMIKIDNQKTINANNAISGFINKVKDGKALKDINEKKVQKIIQSINENELLIFSEYLAIIDKDEEFKQLIKSLD